MGYVFDAMNRADDSHSELPPAVESAEQPAARQTPPPAASEVDTTAASASQQPAEAPVQTRHKPSDERSDGNVIELSSKRLNAMDDRLVCLKSPSSVPSEEYRSIRTSLLAKWKNSDKQVHLITSATPQEGKTITSLNLGLSLSEMRSLRVVVIEADLRLPTFAKLLNLKPEHGIIGYLRGESTQAQMTHRLGRLDIMPAGGRAADEAVQLLSSNRMIELLKTLRQQYDHIIIDTPPVLELADAGILGEMSDEVLLIARMQRTPRSLVEQATRTLASYDVPVAGVIATDQKCLRQRYHYYRYGYRYRYGYHGKRNKHAA